VVLYPVPSNSTIEGVPARVVGEAASFEPSRTMDQILSDFAYASFNYPI
jgi:serine O-acetyltransferase